MAIPDDRPLPSDIQPVGGDNSTPSQRFVMSNRNLRQLARRSQIPESRLIRIFRRAAPPTYFDCLKIQHATSGKITPDDFRSILTTKAETGDADTMPPRPRNRSHLLFHGEAMWGSRLGQTLATIIIESGMSPSEWFKAHNIPQSTIHSMLLDNRIPRNPLRARLESATKGRITITQLYDPSWRRPRTTN